ncbi:MAG: hypothetical protein AAGD07_09360 [Planctomycetota bacterium]
MPDNPPTIVHIAYPTWRKNALVALARAKELQEQGESVLITHCAATFGTCAVNYLANPLTCAACKRLVRQNTSQLGLPLVELDPSRIEPDVASLQVENTELKEAMEEGVTSGLISAFRMLPDDMRDSKRISRIRSRYLANAYGLYSQLLALARSRHAARIEVFNGRHACSRFCLSVAEVLGLPFNTMEVTACGKPAVFAGHRPHDRRNIQKRVLSYPADYEIAERYYGRRQAPTSNKFAKKHGGGFTPPDANAWSKRISVFLSSQDEFESLGPDWRSPFADYASVLRDVVRRNPDKLFCIRFHPNQAAMTSDVVTPFSSIESLPNTQVYYPDATVDSYGLMQWSDWVVTFGSTVAVEACWMGKPSVILGPSYYDGLDVAYVPNSIDQLCDLLKQDLPAKSRDNAARWATYATNDGDDFAYIDYDGRNIHPKGFAHRGLISTRVARGLNNFACHAIRKLNRKAA